MRQSLRASLHLYLHSAVILGVLALPSAARALNPDSPEVKRAIDKGLKFLSTLPPGQEPRIGGRCLMAMAFLKNGHDGKHPFAQDATDHVLKLAARDVDEISRIDVYSLGIAIMYLCDVDPSRYHSEIEKLLHGLEKRQQAAGGWGYLSGAHAGTGDTSMTQYGVLATWAAHRHGVAASQDSVERVCNWLIRTQDPEGCWGYQGNDPGVGIYKRLEQKGNFMSLTAAGCGASYICADLLGFSHPIEEDKAEEGLPPALKLVKNDPKQPNGKGPLTKVVDAKLLGKARLDGARWLSQRESEVPLKRWEYYYLYALERYHSFRELSEGAPKGDPNWYNVGARFIIKDQKPDGSFESNCGLPVDTAFAILFLSRSTKKSIEKAAYGLGEGNLVGGQGLPQDLTQVKLKKGRVVARSLGGSMEELLTRLENPTAPPIADLEEVDELNLSEVPAEREHELNRLRALLMKGRSEARVAAAMILARTQELDNAPALIFALGDPDRRVPPLANEGLKFISRRFTGYELASAAAEPDRLALRDKWKTWYRSIRPDGELPE